MAFNLGMLIKPILVLQTLNVPSKVVLAFRTDTKFQGVLRPWHSLFRSGQRSWKGPWRWPSPEADRQKRSHQEATGSCNPIYPSCVHTYSVYVYIYIYIYWLVVPIHGKKMFQTTNQYIYIVQSINHNILWTVMCLFNIHTCIIVYISGTAPSLNPPQEHMSRVLQFKERKKAGHFQEEASATASNPARSPTFFRFSFLSLPYRRMRSTLDSRLEKSDPGKAARQHHPFFEGWLLTSAFLMDSAGSTTSRCRKGRWWAPDPASTPHLSDRRGSNEWLGVTRLNSMGDWYRLIPKLILKNLKVSYVIGVPQIIQVMDDHELVLKQPCWLGVPSF